MFSYSQWLDELLKAAGHKYIKRIPYQSGGKMRYRYIYHARQTHQGKHIFDPSHLKEGTKLMWHGDDGAQVHVEIKSFDGEHAVIQYDDGPKKGEFDVLSLADLHDRLDAVSGGGKARLSEARAKEEKKLADMHTRGVSSKQLARQKKRVEALGGVSVASPLGLPTSAPASARHAAKKIEDTLSQLDDASADQMRPKFEKLAQELVSAMENEKRVRSSSGNALRGTPSAINKVEQAQYKLTQMWNRALKEVQTAPRESDDSVTTNAKQSETKKDATTIAHPPRTSEKEGESLQTQARVLEALRRAVAMRVPPIEVKKGKIKKEPTQDHIETRMFFGAALRNLSGVGAMALGNQLQTKESMRHVAEIYKATHTKGTDFEEAKNAAFMPILEHVISELEGFDRDTWFGDDLEGREQLERRLDTLKKIKAGEREQ
jgi:hypothetical protein